MTRRPTILVVWPYRSEYGPRLTLEHVHDALAAGGYDVVCAVPEDAKLPASSPIQDSQLRFLSDLNTFPRTLNPARLGEFFREHRAAGHELARIAIEENAEAVYSISEAIFCGGLAAHEAGIPSLVHAIGLSIQSPRAAAAFYIRSLARLTDVFIACSSAVAALFTNHGIPDERVVVVHNGLDVALVELASQEPFTIEHPGPKVGMVAAFDARKGHDLFIAAAARIAETVPDARFYLLGGALAGHPESFAYERRVAELIAERGLEDRFVQPGYLPRPDIYHWITAMDVVVVPSRTEAFSLALLEAMACRRPVVATRIEGNLDAFVHRQSGIYVRRDPDALAEEVELLLRDPDLRRSIGEAANERVKAFFDLSVTQPAYVHVVRQLIASGQTRPAAR